MADLRPQYNEEAVGANHPTKADVINRAYNVEHAEDGTHAFDSVTEHAVMIGGASGAAASLAAATTGQMLYGVTGSDPAWGMGEGIKGRIQLNGTGTPAIADSFNVSGITDLATGSYTVTWDTDFLNDDYACGGMAIAGCFVHISNEPSNPNVGYVKIDVRDYDGSAQDVSCVTVIAIGDQ